MVTVCWSVKGGSGTTVVAAGLALGDRRPSLLVDFAGDLPTAFGIPSPDRPGIVDWLASDAPPDRLDELVVEVAPRVELLPGAAEPGTGSPTVSRLGTLADERWRALGSWLNEWETRRDGVVTIDAGTGVPHAQVLALADRGYLVTRACYLALRRAMAANVHPDAVILVTEPGHTLSARAVEHALGAPVEKIVPYDPAVARAVDAGLLAGGLPRTLRQTFRTAA